MDNKLKSIGILSKLGITPDTPGWEDSDKRILLNGVINYIELLKAIVVSYPDDPQRKIVIANIHGYINTIASMVGKTFEEVERILE